MGNAVHLLALTAAISAVATSGAAQADVQPVDWLTGAALEQRLAAPVNVSWTNTPAARALKSLAVAQHVAIVLDRRIDPDREIILALAGEPLADCLRKLAAKLDAGYCQLGAVAYLGPAETTKKLRTLAAQQLEQVKPLAPQRRREFLRQRETHWEDLAEPRQIVAGLAEEAGVKLVGAERIPHDLWPAADLPMLTWIDRFALLAAQFDLTFRIEQGGKQVVLVPLPAHVAIARTYQAPGQAAALAKRWAEALPEARVTARGNTVRVEGLLEDHEDVERRLRGTPTRRTTVAAGKELYQLSVDNAALDKVVEQLAGRLNLLFTWDRAAIDRAGISVEQLISVNVKDADLDQLLRAVLNNTGLAFRRDDRKVSIYPVR